MQDFLDFLGAGFCHQIRERTLEAGGLYFPVCARDTGIYLGLFFTVLIICLYYWRRGTAIPSGMPPFWALLVAVALILPMAFDGLTSYLHMRQTSNLLRFITGYATGAGVGLVASCAITGMLKNSTDDLRVLANWRLLVAVLFASSVLGLIFWLLYPYMNIFSPLLLAAVFLTVVTALNLLIVSMTKFGGSGASNGGSPRRLRWLIALGISVCLAFVEISVMGMVKVLFFETFFDGRVSSFQELF
jgi:uncharacterized membrane protein